jgi:ABC-type molybdate transport system substrate-binding protein
VSEPDALRLLAAGSLRAVMGELCAAWTRDGGAAVKSDFGASGLLRARIEAGEAVDLFASANLAHPQALAARGIGGVQRFAGNRICALVAPQVQADSAGLLDAMLDPLLQLGTSTPGADPSGDYAVEVLDRAERLRPGAATRLRAKALPLTGAPGTWRPADGRNIYGALVADGHADIFLTYFTNTLVALRESPQLRRVELPPELAVGADFGLIAFTPRGLELAQRLLSEPAQRMFAAHGFGTA